MAGSSLPAITLRYMKRFADQGFASSSVVAIRPGPTGRLAPLLGAADTSAGAALVESADASAGLGGELLLQKTSPMKVTNATAAAIAINLTRGSPSRCGSSNFSGDVGGSA